MRRLDALCREVAAFRVQAKQGINRVPLSRRIGRRKLAPGAYLVGIEALRRRDNNGITPVAVLRVRSGRSVEVSARPRVARFVCTSASQGATLAALFPIGPEGRFVSPLERFSRHASPFRASAQATSGRREDESRSRGSASRWLAASLPHSASVRPLAIALGLLTLFLLAAAAVPASDLRTVPLVGRVSDRRLDLFMASLMTLSVLVVLVVVGRL